MKTEYITSDNLRSDSGLTPTWIYSFNNVSCTGYSLRIRNYTKKVLKNMRWWLLKITDSPHHSKYVLLFKFCFVLIGNTQPLHKTGFEKEILFQFCKCIISSLSYSTLVKSMASINNNFTHSSKLDCSFPIPACLATAIQERERNRESSIHIMWEWDSKRCHKKLTSSKM